MAGYNEQTQAENDNADKKVEDLKAQVDAAKKELDTARQSLNTTDPYKKPTTQQDIYTAQNKLTQLEQQLTQAKQEQMNAAAANGHMGAQLGKYFQNSFNNAGNNVSGIIDNVVSGAGSMAGNAWANSAMGKYLGRGIDAISANNAAAAEEQSRNAQAQAAKEGAYSQQHFQEANRNRFGAERVTAATDAVANAAVNDQNKMSKMSDAKAANLAIDDLDMDIQGARAHGTEQAKQGEVKSADKYNLSNSAVSSQNFADNARAESAQIAGENAASDMLSVGGAGIDMTSRSKVAGNAGSNDDKKPTATQETEQKETNQNDTYDGAPQNVINFASGSSLRRTVAPDGSMRAFIKQGNGNFVESRQYSSGSNYANAPQYTQADEDKLATFINAHPEMKSWTQEQWDKWRGDENARLGGSGFVEANKTQKLNENAINGVKEKF